MMSQLVRLTASTALLLATTLSPLIAAPVPAEGSKAPTFSLPSQDGTPVSLKKLSGKWVVLYFYPKDNTPGCTIEAHNFQRDLSQYEALNAMIVGVSVDNADSHKDFCAKQGLTFKLLADTEKKVSEEYGSLNEKGMSARNTFLISPKGKITKVWTGVKPQPHSEEVLAALKEVAKK